MKVAFAMRFAEPVAARLAAPCEMIVDDEAGIGARLGDVDVLVSMAFTPSMAEAEPRLRLVQVPGLGSTGSTASHCAQACICPMPMAMRPASPNTPSAP